MTDHHPLAALPFSFRRSTERMDVASYSSTTHTVHGLLLLHGDRLVLQWRKARTTERMGAASMETDREIDPIREHVVPLASVAGASVRRSRWPFVKPRLVLRAADLLAFEDVTGSEGLELDHPGELPLRLRRADLLPAEEFVAELSLALARGSERVEGAVGTAGEVDAARRRGVLPVQPAGERPGVSREQIDRPG